MKTSVRFLSYILSFVLLLTCFSFSGTVFAEESGIFEYRIEVENNGSGDVKVAVLTGIDSSASGNIVVPDNLDGYPVAVIDGAFKYRSDITSVVLPDTVTVITASSFAYCYNLQSITMSSNLAYLGESAFSACILLETVDLPDTLLTMEQYAFSWCEGLKSVKIPEGISKLNRGVFTGCISLSEIDVHDNLTVIEQDVFTNTAFYRDENNWDNDVLYLGCYAISGRDSITGSVELKEGTKLIAEYAFVVSEMSSIILADSLKTVNKDAFNLCNNLTNVYYPGDEQARRNIWVAGGNNKLEDALWHYGYDPNVKEYMPGDINGDDEVDNKDLLRLFKYLSEWDVEVIDDVMDVNKDGNIDNKDLTRLFQYLSGWNVKIYSKTTGGNIGGDDHGPIVEF